MIFYISYFPARAKQPRFFSITHGRHKERPEGGVELVAAGELPPDHKPRPLVHHAMGYRVQLTNHTITEKVAQKLVAVGLASWPEKKPETMACIYDRPVYPPKMRACRSCGVATINYFKCPTCWSNEGDDMRELFDPIDEAYKRIISLEERRRSKEFVINPEKRKGGKVA